MKCIVCNNKMKKKYSYGDEEYCYSCSKCKYEESFAYGLYEEGVVGYYLSDREFKYSVMSLRYSYNAAPTNTEYRRYIKGLWSYRKLLIRKGIIKGRKNSLK